MDNQQSYWYIGQVVTALQMNNFTQDLYARFTDLTQQQAPCILNIGAISQSMGDVTVGAGSFRFPDATYGFLPYDTGIFGNAPSATIAVTGDGFIVARYTITPTSPTQTNYTFPTEYLFVASVDPVTDVMVVQINSGVISGYGNFLNYYPDITDDTFTNTVTISGAGGFIVNSDDSTVLNQVSTVPSNKAVVLTTTEISTNNDAKIYTQVNTTSHSSTVGLVTSLAGVEQFTLQVNSGSRTSLFWPGSLPALTSNNVLVTDDFTQNQNIIANGYQILPGGLIIQWGKATILNGNSSVSVTLPLTFPNAGYSASAIDNSGASGFMIKTAGFASTSTLNIFSNVAAISDNDLFWMAIGN
jgi:hypothetical protein